MLLIVSGKVSRRGQSGQKEGLYLRCLSLGCHRYLEVEYFGLGYISVDCTLRTEMDSSCTLISDTVYKTLN